jgi:hypothetical protein
MSQKGIAMKLYQHYAALLQSKQAFDAEVKKYLHKGFLPSDVVTKLAELHAACFNLKGSPCFYDQKENGSWKFYTAESMASANRHHAAQKAWERNVQPYQQLVKDSRGGSRKVNLKKSPVDALLAMYNKLSASEKKAFNRAINA